MENNKKISSLSREIWLLYYNKYLFEHGAITEDERNKMINIIHEQNNKDFKQ